MECYKVRSPNENFSPVIKVTDGDRGYWEGLCGRRRHDWPLPRHTEWKIVVIFRVLI